MALPIGMPSEDRALRPQWVESLHQCGHTRITRLVLPGADGKPVRVIRKEAFGPDPSERLRHEQAMLERLEGVPGITPLAGQQPYPDSLVLADVSGRSLDCVPTPLEPARLAALAITLTGTVAEMHRRGVVHRDINPANILLAESGERHDPPRVYLIDFALATTSTEVRPAFTHLNEIGGALPYLAPEQTGRVGWPVDQRADLYALGATLYELATGTPPFGRSDPLRLSHDHLARVPTPPHQANPAVGPTLSAIIMHLLEKEPDNRYQSAEGLLHDLRQLTVTHPDGTATCRIGEHDHPARLNPPSRLVGRGSEIAGLGRAFAEAMAGQSRSVLISGPPGVGKTALIDELRPVVTASNGWFLAGKSDQYRRDQEFEAAWQAFQQLGQLLLAEPEEELAQLRHRLREELGPDAGLLAALHSEFETLLQVRPVPVVDDPLTNQARLQHIGAVVLRAVASPSRPVVLALDDLQWAGRTPLGLVDTIISEGGRAGLLLVGAYREQELNGGHPLSAMVSRWRANGGRLVELRLGNLARGSVAELLTDVLRLAPERATALAHLVEPYVNGNPNDTVELLDSLRREDLLTPAGGTWRWDPESIRQRMEGAVIADLVAARAEALPPATRSLVQAMACLGGRAELAVLRVATGAPAARLEQCLAPALDDGLLVTEAHGHREAIRFRHDRVQEVVLRRLPADQHDAWRLRLARRLAGSPELFAVAAEQYLPVVGLVSQPRERRQVADLLRRAAERAQLLSNHPVVERCLTAAVQLIDPADRAALIEVHTGRQAALYNLGRLEEADEAYGAAMRLCGDPMDEADATLVQVSSLTNRNRPQQAVQLGLDLLARLGHPAPDAERLGTEVEQGLDAFGDWFRQEKAADPHRSELTDPRLLKVGALINRMMPPAYFTDHVTMGWLALRAWQIWVEHGPGRTLVGPVSHIPYAITVQRDDHRTAHAASRQVLAASESHGYEPGTSQSRFLYALAAWSHEPLEECLHQAELASDGLIRGGDLQNACYSRHVTVSHLFECAPSLAECGQEVAAALTFAERTGNERFSAGHRIYQELVRFLRGAASGLPLDQIWPETLAANPTAQVHLHLARALLAALFGNQSELQAQSAKLNSCLPMIAGTYPTCVAHLLRGLALAEATRTAGASDRPALLSALDQEIDWLADRAADSPENLLHLLRLVEAERSWAAGEQRAAIGAFDAAVREVGRRQRPWHRALTLERAARYHLSQGLEHTGHMLLAQARQAYHDWGANAKVRQLDWAYPTLDWDLRPSAPAPLPHRGGESVNPPAYRPGVTSGSIDLLGIHAASQVLSSATTVEGLGGRIVEVLGGMTGATAVQLLLWGEEEQGWLAATPESGSEPVRGLAGAQRRLPDSAIRYVERTGEPVVVADATCDDRFARDQLGICSLMVVPVRSRGELQAMLVLENRLIRNAFTAERLEAVMLIAGQLAVSLRNALVYSSLERKVAERTGELALANDRLEQLSITDPLTGLPNRRRLETVLGGEWERGQRARTPLALAMVDIDHFKPYNDHYGHLAGDRCLQRVSAMLTKHLRDDDLAARYGGEEFAVVMPGMALPEAVRAAERLRAAVVTLGEPHPPVPEQLVTVSVGVAAMVPPATGRVSQLTALADTELYRAKRAGRNRVRPVLPERRYG